MIVHQSELMNKEFFEMEHLETLFEQRLSHMWLGSSSLCSGRDYRFEQPGRALRVGVKEM